MSIRQSDASCKKVGMIEEQQVLEAAALISASSKLVAFTGAGVSEESGIPTFRDPGGLWDRFDPYEIGGGDVFASLSGGRGIPPGALEFVSEMLPVLKRARPNPGHMALAELEAMGILRSVITQNIDNLHREAGNTRVIEVHGNIFRLVCLSCGSKQLLERDEIFRMGDELVRCLETGDVEGLIRLASRCPCGGICRMDVVGFGEPVQEMPEAMSEARTSDLMLILGTSGAVYPAAYLPGHARKTGSKIIEINASGCYFQEVLDVGIVARTGDALPVIVKKVKELLGTGGHGNG
jgi:NAD-dependent deacetylase